MPELNLTPTFNTWAQLTMLHLYILTTRLRCLPPPTFSTWSQHLTDHFFLGAETRMETLHSITSRGARSKYLKDLFQQWRGVLVSYDEGLVKGDAVLASAVWRNVFSGKEDVDPVRLAMVVAYLRREVMRCAGEGDAMSWSRFGGLKSEEPVVLMKSHFMDKPLPVDAGGVTKGQAKV
jgi:cytochrome b pre-mRNA-processing protein 3